MLGEAETADEEVFNNHGPHECLHKLYAEKEEQMGAHELIDSQRGHNHRLYKQNTCIEGKFAPFRLEQREGREEESHAKAGTTC